MKTHLWLPILLIVFCLPVNSQAQCTSFNNDPPPLQLSANCDQPFFNAITFTRGHAFFLPNLIAGTTYGVSLCFSEYPLLPNQMELVFVDADSFSVITAVNNCFVEVTPPADGDYFVIFNEVGQCGVPGTDFGFGVEYVEFCQSCNLDRLLAAQLALDPFTGLDFSPALENMFMPPIDFGFGPGFEGKLPAGTILQPFLGGAPFFLPFDAYLIYIDKGPPLNWTHPVRFVIMSCDDCTPTISEGTLIILEADSWPVVSLPLQPPLPLFGPDVFTSDPPGPGNPDGLLAGELPDPGAGNIGENPPDTNSTSNSAGIVVVGDNSARIRSEIPTSRSSLQDDHGVDSTRILGSASDSAVTIAGFCALLDSLCTLMPSPDTIYIRIASHGKVDSIVFADGKLGKNAFCQKIRNVAKKGVPVMLTIETCNSGSMLDANNWNLPAGSMVLVTAASGRSSFGWYQVSRADSSGNAIPGTSFTGNIHTRAIIDCKRDTTDSDNDGKTDADTNEDGNVDDCEAFNWMNTQKPCYVATLNPPRMLGSFVITTWRFYPAGPPAAIPSPDSVLPDGRIIKDGAVIWPNPMPSYRPVGNFAGSMNFNVQNNTGGPRNTFYMVFCGDVSGGIGAAWNSTATDSLTGTWATSLDVTTTYDAVNDETTVCWMASGDPAADQGYVHFGYVAPSGKTLRPKRQYWANSSPESAVFLVQPDGDKVPTTQSGILLHGSGSPLTVTTVNLGTNAGGWGEPLNYTIGYRVAKGEIPLENLSLGDSMINTLTYHAVGSGSLDTNDLFEFNLDLPDAIRVGDVFVLQVELDWALNSNTTLQLLQWPVLNATLCEADIIFASGDTVPNQVNSNGIILLDNPVFRPGLTT